MSIAVDGGLLSRGRSAVVMAGLCMGVVLGLSLMLVSRVGAGASTNPDPQQDAVVVAGQAAAISFQEIAASNNGAVLAGKPALRPIPTVTSLSQWKSKPPLGEEVAQYVRAGGSVPGLASRSPEALTSVIADSQPVRIQKFTQSRINTYFTGAVAELETSRLPEYEKADRQAGGAAIDSGISEFTVTDVRIQETEATVVADAITWASIALLESGRWVNYNPVNMGVYTIHLQRDSAGTWRADTIEWEFQPGQGP